MADYPHLTADGRKATLRRLLRAAGLGGLDGEHPATHDEEGRLILRGSSAVRAWLKGHGLLTATG